MDRSDIEKKWIIEIPKTANKIIVVGVYGDKEVYAYSVDVHDLDSYTEPDTEKVREEAFKNGYDAACKDIDIKSKTNAAYRKGYQDATVKISSDEQAIAEEAYQSGLKDAWAAARKIAVSVPLGGMSQLAIKRMFGVEWQYVLMNCTPATVIEKIRQHEQEQKQEQEQIQVGDEVIAKFSGIKYVIVKVKGSRLIGFSTEWATCDIDAQFVEKTGRHFHEIATALEKMRGE